MTRNVTQTSQLSNLFSPYFASTTRRKGRDYCNDDSIIQFKGTTHNVTAKVVGTRRYDVSLDYIDDSRELNCFCTCPAFDDSGACKHLWAVILLADRKGALSAAREAQCSVLTPQWQDELDEYGYIRDEDDDDEEADDTDADTFVIDLGDGNLVQIKGGPDVLASLKPFLKKAPAPSNVKSTPAQPAPWGKALAPLTTPRKSEGRSGVFWVNGRQPLYILDVSGVFKSQVPMVEIAVQDRKLNGEWSKPRHQRPRVGDIDDAPDPRDRKALHALNGLRGVGYYNSYSHSGWDEVSSPVTLSEGNLDFILPLICDTGRCWLRTKTAPDAELIRLTWDSGPAWRLTVDVHEKSEGGDYAITGLFRRGEEVMPLSAPQLLLRGGVMFIGEKAVRFDDVGQFEWISVLRDNPRLTVPRHDGGQLAETLVTMERRVPLQLPSQLHIEEQTGEPKPTLRLVKGRQYGRPVDDRMHASVEFDYEGKLIAHDHAEEGFLVQEPRRMIRRNRDAETGAMDLLHALSFRQIPESQRHKNHHLEVKVRKLPAALTQLIAAGWRVEAEGKPYRSAGAVNIKVASGIDWFELSGKAQFDDQQVDLPQLLAALRRGENSIVLGDGTIGMLPEEWLSKYGTLASLGAEKEGSLRFSHAQVGLLDALLAAMPEATCDKVFDQARNRLRQFDGVKAADAPAGFGGELRPYQREGLGWLQFLREFRFGGCLADDMGLGKTIQVLAMLEARRLEKDAARAQEHEQRSGKSEGNTATPKPKSKSGKKTNGRRGAEPVQVAATPAGLATIPRPSLVVLPRSLVFNWQKEAEKFTPSLRLLDHSGIDRICRSEGDHTQALSDYDLILTTYGTLRADAAKLKDVKFDYVILDEAQAVKNAATASAKAVRLLRGEHRLVMTGTPVENRLSDLWSLFEFLNPGMLGSANVFKMLSGTDSNSSAEARQLLGKALRPFILRRKKDQVARDLPARIEQTLYCELEPKQRKLYNQLREHYRKSLLSKIDSEGMNKSKMHVLEALLRLRQAACHPGLIDQAMHNEPSAKLDVLLPQLQELIDEGHKVLVFSQFTSLLAILRKRLDAEKMTHEYLDGQTRDRQACVDRFQNDPACPLFLISLKAGGVGLNLTAAEHVFLLDPWWNPAVEAQAIDRAHRIGQTNQVFAFRLIARDTVEEKVLELQNSKRELADAIINQDNSLITRLGREDLEMLLS